MCSPTGGSGLAVDSDVLGFPSCHGNSCLPIPSLFSLTRILGFGCGRSLVLGFPHVFTLKAAGIRGDEEHGKWQVTSLRKMGCLHIRLIHEVSCDCAGSAAVTGLGEVFG